MVVANSPWPTRVVHVASVVFGTWPIFHGRVHSSVERQPGKPTPGCISFKLSRRQVYSWLRGYSLYTVWLLIAASVQIYHTTKSNYLHSEISQLPQYSNLKAINKKLVLAESWTFSVTTFVNMVVAYFTSRHILAMMQTFSDVSTWLDRITLIREELECARSVESRLLILWLFASYTTIALAMAVECSGLLFEQRESYLLKVSLQDLGKLGAMTFDLQFASCCGKLATLFQGVNIILDCIRKSCDTHSGQSYKNCNWERGRRSLRVPDSHRYPEMGELNRVHRTLCDLAVRVKKIYQIPIASNVTVCFLNTVCVLFTTISQYRTGIDWTLWISSPMWVAFYAIRVIMVCISAAIAVERAHESKRHLTHLDDRGLNDRLKFQVEHFSDRVSTLDLRFKLCGLMTIDKSFLSSACLGIVTYLVIALQYSYT